MLLTINNCWQHTQYRSTIMLILAICILKYNVWEKVVYWCLGAVSHQFFFAIMLYRIWSIITQQWLECYNRWVFFCFKVRFFVVAWGSRYTSAIYVLWKQFFFLTFLWYLSVSHPAHLQLHTPQVPLSTPPPISDYSTSLCSHPEPFHLLVFSLLLLQGYIIPPSFVPHGSAKQ